MVIVVMTTKIPESERKTGQIRNIPKQIMDNATPLRVFELLFGELIEHIIAECNSRIKK